MYVPDIELHEPTTLEEASAVITRVGPRARYLAGGTDLLVDLKTDRVKVDHLVSLNRIESLRGISEVDGNLRIGAMTTITQLHRSAIVNERFRPILDATGKMAAPQIRNVATVGGNVSSAVPCADLPPILTAMNATVVLFSPQGKRELPIDSFFLGARRTVRREDEVIIAIVVPSLQPRFGAAYARFALREGNAIAVAGTAASLLLDNQGNITDARIILGAVAPIPIIVDASEKLIGRAPNDELFQQAADLAMTAAQPISDVRGSADFRREIVRVMTMRALKTAHTQAKENR